MEQQGISKVAKIAGSLALATALAAPAIAEMSAEELAKLAQNPVGNLVSVQCSQRNAPLA
ncbi:hypothetical protein [Accumulibacter sp.]|uniref:hypothetical protein n=1 Tax=Accumulibacter sp. TaxID=2053492 RepID=UPI00263415A5|nr:hypothetical protein [Accumulibacter sp.]